MWKRGDGQFQARLGYIVRAMCPKKKKGKGEKDCDVCGMCSVHRLHTNAVLVSFGYLNVLGLLVKVQS